MLGKLTCELLPSDIYAKSDKFAAHPRFHHFSIKVSILLPHCKCCYTRRFFKLYQRYKDTDTVDCAVASLNKALSELNNWCQVNSLTPHSAKCEAMLLMRKPHIGPLNSVIIGDNRIDWVKHTRLLGVTIDDRLAWSHHLTDVKKSFVNKLNLLKREKSFWICILRSSCRQFFMALSSGAVVLMQSN